MSEVVEAVLKLKLQDDEVFSDMDKLAAKLGVISTERRKAHDELNELIAQEQKLLAARDKANSPTAIVKYNDEIKKTQDSIAGVKAKLEEATKSEQKLTTQTEKLDDTLDKAFQVAGIESTKKEVDALGKEIDATGKQAKKTGNDLKDMGKSKGKIQLGQDVKQFVTDLTSSGISVKAQIKSMEDALAKLDDTDPRFEPLKASLLEMKDRFKDFKEDINANTGEPLEKLSGNLKNLTVSLLTLDFTQAGKSMRGLALAVKELKFTDVLSGIKGMGKNLLDLGKAILGNPIFLIATVIILIIVNFDKLKKSGGFLGEMFRFIGRVVQAVIDAFTTLTDWLGLTNSAFDKQQEALQATIDSYDKLIEAQRAAAKSQEELYESQRRLSISLIKDTKERNKALNDLDEELYLNKLNNRAADTQNLTDQLAAQRQQLEDNAKQNADLLSHLEGQGKDISSITIASAGTDNGQIDFSSPLLKGFTLPDDLKKQKDKLDEIQQQIADNTNQNAIDANNFLAKQNEKTNELLEQAQKDYEQYLKDRKRIFDSEAKKLLEAQNAFRQAIIDNQLNGANQIAASYDLQRQMAQQAAAADELEASATLNKADAAKYNLEVQKRLTVQLMTLGIKQKAEEIKNAKEVSDATIEAAKTSADYEIELALLSGSKEADVYQQRYDATKTYYDDKLTASDAYYQAEIEAAAKELVRLQNDNTATADQVAQQQTALTDLVQTRLDKEIAITQEQSLALAKLRADRLKAEFEANKDELSEEERHVLEMMDIAGATDSEKLDSEIDYEKQKLKLLQDSGQASELEITEQNNKVLELEAKKDAILKKMEMEKNQAIIQGIADVTSAVVDGADKILQAQIDMYEKMIEAQQNRVNQAKEIAQHGNAELLDAEQKRLDDLQKKREKFVRAQQALAVVELISNTAVAVSKAAAEGGAAAPFTIAAALIALVAGLAQARVIASQAAFFEGGYTGDGNPREESRSIGTRPYTYHKAEWVFNHQKTARYKDIFEKIHTGKVDLREMESKAMQFDKIRQLPMINTAASLILPMAHNGMEIAELRNDIHDLTSAVKSQERLSVHIDEKGIHSIASRYESRNRRNDKLAS